MKHMKRLGLVCFWGLICCLLAAPPVFAETVLEKIDRTGSITMGYREGGVPFGYINDKGEWGGFDMDLGDILVQKLEEKLGKKIKYNKTPINPKTRIVLVANRTVDIVMGATTITMAREEVVDFSLPYFLTGTKVLVPKGSSIRSFKDLAGKRVGAGNGCTPHIKALNNAIADKRIDPACEIVLFEDHLKGFLGLQQGKVDAYFTDESMLAGMVAKARNPQDWEIVGSFVTYEPYGFILPKDDSDWRDFVNATLIGLIRSGEFEKIYEKWFGPRGVVVYPMSEEYKNMLNVLTFPE
ncbi:MAG: ABC transporter substrate-binding protein [Desulfatibacillum sp.]|nr:ABC transporter substrate-binding protein [Desulfatibacillum sp.]